MTRTQAWSRSLLLALPVAALLLSGCSAKAPEGDAAGTGGDTESAADIQTWSVKYAGCMQDEGIDYPDPVPDSNGMMEALDIDALGGMDVFAAADETCRGKIGDPPPPTGPDGKPLTEEDMRESTLELTKCLREQGVDIEDPAEGGGLTLDETIPEEAMEACGLADGASVSMSAG